MISYEVFMGLALMGIFMVYGTTRVSGIVDGQNEYWFGSLIPMWGVFMQPLGFCLLYTSDAADDLTLIVHCGRRLSKIKTST